jgi:serine/threonine protein kinase
LLDCVEALHSVGYIHGDLKFQNVLTSLNPDLDRVFLIDFGLSYKYLTPEGGHIEKVKRGHFSGNFLFSSLNQCRTYTVSRRDDIESLLYMLIFMLNKYYLPWCDYQERFHENKINLSQLLKKRIRSKMTQRVIQLIPSTLHNSFKNVLLLGFDEKP